MATVLGEFVSVVTSVQGDDGNTVSVRKNITTILQDRAGQLYIQSPDALKNIIQLVANLSKKVIEQNSLLNLDKKSYLTLLFHLTAFQNLTLFHKPIRVKCCEYSLLDTVGQLLKNFERRYVHGEMDTVEKTFLEALLSISNHCASSGPLTKPFYDKLNYINVIQPYLQSNDDVVKTECLFCLAYIVDEEKSELFSSNKEHAGFLLATLQQTLRDREEDEMTTWTPDVLVNLISRLAINDTNKRHLVEAGILPLLLRMSKIDHTRDVLSATNLMWTLSFHPENKRTMQADKEFMKNLNVLAKNNNRRIRKAAKGCLWTLGDAFVNEEKKKTPPAPIQGGTTTPGDQRAKLHLMISYSWDNKAKVLKISQELKRASYRIWLDIENMEGSTLEAMALAVEQAAVVLLCVSERYKKSNNCRLEAEYAFKQNKVIVPLMMERYQADGWLGILMGTKMFFDFSGKYSFESRIDGLLQELRDKGRDALNIGDIQECKEISLVQGKHPKLEKSNSSDTQVGSWSHAEVKRWLQPLNLKNPQTFETFDGKQLLYLKNISLTAPEFYFNYLRVDLMLDTFRDLMTFDEELKKLK